MSSSPYILIMAGGIGSRFWPASREHLPKQFLDITGSGKSLIRQTVDRFLDVVPTDHIFVITHADYGQLVAEAIPELKPHQIIEEPSRNNTAASIALASMKLSKMDPDAVCIVAPADHLIQKEDEFERVIRQAVIHATQHASIITLGIEPTRADTGYGYIEYDKTEDHAVRAVKSFREKPERATAEHYLNLGSFAWNAGIFVWKLSVILESFRIHANQIYETLSPGMNVYNTPDEIDFIAKTYPRTEKISVDYAILERASNVYTIPCDIGWSDLGTWASLYEQKNQVCHTTIIINTPGQYRFRKSVDSNMTPKKIAIIANTTWNIYNFRQNIIRKLISEGHEVMVMAPVDTFITYTESIREVTHIPIRHLDRDSVNPFQDLRLCLELLRLYRRHKPDLILHYTVKPNIYGGLAAKLLGIPSVAVVTGLGYSLIHEGWINVITRMLYKLSLPLHRKVIFENTDDKTLFEKAGLVTEGKSISIKGCGVDTQWFSPNGDGRTAGTMTFTFIGRLLYDKGVREFIEAAHIVRKQNANVQFWLVGGIDKENPSSVRNEDLVKWIRDPGIHYLGATDNIRKYIEKSDCIVLPSYREGMPRVIMEAMAMERPVITTDTAGCRETVDENINGYLVPVNDATALANAMDRFVHLDDNMRKEMGKAGRVKVLREFDDRIIADQLYKVIMQA